MTDRVGMKPGAVQDLHHIMLVLDRRVQQGARDVVARTSRTKFWISVAARMFSRAFSTWRKNATAWTWVASSRIPMPPVSMLARNWPDGEFANAVLLKKPTASSIAASALLWKKGRVSAASTSGGVLSAVAVHRAP
jgi:hypothetical protein